MANLTLQGRLIIIMVVFSIFFIAAFTAVQLANQLNVITLFNIHRSKLGAFIAKNSFETILSKSNPADASSLVETFNATMAKLKDSEIIESGRVLSKDGDIIASTDFSTENQISAEEKSQLKQITSEEAKNKWLFLTIDKKRRLVDILVRFTKNDSYFLGLVYGLGNVQEALNQVYGPITITFAVVCIANLVVGLLLSKAILFPIMTLNRVTKEVATGNLDLKVKIRTGDELEQLGETFNHMTAALKKMKERAENANPLTKLPGNIVIMEEVEKRIKSNEKFAVIYADLNDFKAYNDKYGIYRGDEVIKMTADILSTTISDFGNSGDLLGHEGGDDFIIITTPDKAEIIANSILKKFDSVIPSVYGKEDVERGYFTALDRDNKIKKFTTMNIALSGVTNQNRPIKSYAEITNICAEVKRKVKAAKKSAWLMDKRIA